ncbi:MAG: four helix bundle protein [bacterium]
MTKIKSVEEMEVFKKAHALTLKIYQMTEKFPAEEKYGPVSQMKRASSSIAANLMEGSHRLNRKEFRQFAGIARGSAGELKYYLLLVRDLKYLNESDYNILIAATEEIGRMLTGLVNALSEKDAH